MQGDRDGIARKHPWWQQRASTVRRSIAQAVFYCVLAVAWAVVIAPALVEGSGGWRLPVAVFFGVGWVVLAAAYVAGAVAQRREVVSSASR